jgi:2-polyprenyl-6-methoxyphenol hydroxylase-like FAD-dependent oxidoreductase
MPSSSLPGYNVIIAGAGPVGLFLACELRLAGCTVLVLERAAEPGSPLKELPFGLRGLTSSTIDSLDRRDLLSPLCARTDIGRAGLPAHWANQRRQPSGHFAGLQFFHDRVNEAAWPWRVGGPPEPLAVTMADIEAVFAERAAELGVAIRRSCAIDAIEQAADGVVVDAGGQRFAAGWLVGCDGARSVVRKAAGIDFAGTPPEFTGYSALVHLVEPHGLKLGRHHTLTGMYTFTLPGTVTIAEYDGGVHHRAAPTREHVENVLRRVSGSDVRVVALDLASTWTDRAFLAPVYRQGRVLLAGDAAHIHAPLGGQGLNLGLGDAMNLGWKLAAMVRGYAPHDLLDSYQRERRPVAEQVLDWSRAQVALMRPDPGAAALRDVVRDLMETRDGATYFAKRVSGADLRYDLGGSHQLFGRSAPNLRLADGTRLAEHLRSGRSVLVGHASDGPLRQLAVRWALRLDFLTMPPGFNGDVHAMLVRPDGIVAWVGAIGSDVNSAARSIAHWLGNETSS